MLRRAGPVRLDLTGTSQGRPGRALAVGALILVGLLLVFLGVFAAANFLIVVTGVAAIAIAGALSIFANRRA